MISGTRMTDGCHYCEGRPSVRLPTGTPRERARFTPVLELHDPELVGKCIELHLHSRIGAEEFVQTVRLIVDPLSREVCNGGPAGVRIVDLIERPPGWPELYAVKGSALPGAYDTRDRLIVGAYPEFIRVVPPYIENGQEVAGGRCVFRATVSIAGIWTWTYAPPERK